MALSKDVWRLNAWNKCIIGLMHGAHIAFIFAVALQHTALTYAVALQHSGQPRHPGAMPLRNRAGPALHLAR